MWMMGYNDGVELNLHDSFNATSRRLRPLIPRPNLPNNNPNSNIINSTPTSNPPCFFAQYHHLASNLSGDQQSKRDQLMSMSSSTSSSGGGHGSGPQVVVSSRWNPTPEQLRALEELYRRGTRTPSAEQIQHITAQLRRYGKIEGKNVFYWFQNHKARERQKRRRQLESSAAAPSPPPADDPERNKELFEANRTVYEVEQTKNWPPSSNCSTTLSEESVHRAGSNNNNNNKVTGSLQASECVRTDGWFPLAEGELQNRRTSNNNNNNMNFVERNATWQMMQLSCPTHLINAPTCTNNTSNNNNNSNNNNYTNTPRKTASLISSAMDQRLINTHKTTTITTPHHHDHQNGLVKSHLNTTSTNCTVSSQIEDQDYSNICSSSSDDSQTLELFPLRSGNEVLLGEKEPHGLSASAMNTPCQFFEFLPLKN